MTKHARSRPTATTALAYALYDAEHTTRLSEDDPDAQSAYLIRARRLIYAIRSYRTKSERASICAAIKKST